MRKDFRCLIIYFPKELLLFSTDCEFVLSLINRGGHGTWLENLDGPNLSEQKKMRLSKDKRIKLLRHPDNMEEEKSSLLGVSSVVRAVVQ